MSNVSASSRPCEGSGPAASTVHIVIPSLKVSGGVLEAIRLGHDLRAPESPVQILTMWQSPHPMATGDLDILELSRWRTRAAWAALQLPLLMLRFARLIGRRSRGTARGPWIFTHYSTLPLAWLVSRERRFFFVQDLEWRFLGRSRAASTLKRIILATYRSGRVIAANRYLQDALAAEAVTVAGQARIWADDRYAQPMSSGTRDIDVAMVLRKGAHKRLDLYLDAIEALTAQGRSVKIAAITPEDEIAAQVRDRVDTVLVRPDIEQMIALYRRSKIFLHLSEHEGFGLPPLEAMGCGCVPLCRDSGGVRSYMTGPLADLLLPSSQPTKEVVDALLKLLDAGVRLRSLSAAGIAIFADGLVQARTRAESLRTALELGPATSAPAPAPTRPPEPAPLGVRPSTCILLATFNASEWLDEQLESLFRQHDVDVRVVASDDASTDGTMGILEAWRARAPLDILPPTAARLGNANRNFLRLICDVPPSSIGDHVALCDHDDIWLHDKLARAIQELKRTSADAYSSNVTAFWPDGREKVLVKSAPQRRYDHLFESAGPGCTFVFPRKSFLALQAWIRPNLQALQDVKVHDWLIYAWARSQGWHWHIDSESHMRYRQHERNEVGANDGWRSARIRWEQVRSGKYRTDILDIAHAVGNDSPVSIALSRLRLRDRLYLCAVAPLCRRRWHEAAAWALFCWVMRRPS